MTKKPDCNSEPNNAAGQVQPDGSQLDRASPTPAPAAPSSYEEKGNG
jgi:hypothetical protein